MTRIDFEGQVVIVTGAGRGLGRTHALEFARRGARVVVNDLRGSADYGEQAEHSAAEDVVEEIRAAGGEAIPCFETVGTAEGCQAIVRETLDTYGAIDAIVHNAGLRRHLAFADLTVEQIDLVVDVSLGGGLWLTHAAWPHMLERGYGRIVLTASGAGAFGMACGAQYVAAKSGLIGLTRGLAIEGDEHGIRVNALLPAALTGFDAVGRRPAVAPHGQPEERFPDHFGPELVSPMAVYLASRGCAVNGELYSAVGGRFARVFTAVTPGWFGPYEEPAAPEDIAGHLAEIRDETGYWLPQTVSVEVNTVIAQRPERAKPPH